MPRFLGPTNLLKVATYAATTTFNISQSDFQTVTLTGNVTVAISNVMVGQQFTLMFVQDATGSRIVTWFSTIKWPGGTVPTLTTTANKTDVFTFVCTSAGTYLGFTAGQSL